MLLNCFDIKTFPSAQYTENSTSSLLFSSTSLPKVAELEEASSLLMFCQLTRKIKFHPVESASFSQGPFNKFFEKLNFITS